MSDSIQNKPPLEFYGPRLLYEWKELKPQFEDDQITYIEHTAFMARETGATQLVMIPFMPFSLVVWPSGKISLVTKRKTDEEEGLEWWTKTHCTKCGKPLIEYMLKAKQRGDEYVTIHGPKVLCGDCKP